MELLVKKVDDFRDDQLVEIIQILLTTHFYNNFSLKLGSKTRFSVET